MLYIDNGLKSTVPSPCDKQPWLLVETVAQEIIARGNRLAMEIQQQIGSLAEATVEQVEPVRCPEKTMFVLKYQDVRVRLHVSLYRPYRGGSQSDYTRHQRWAARVWSGGHKWVTYNKAAQRKLFNPSATDVDPVRIRDWVARWLPVARERILAAQSAKEGLQKANEMAARLTNEAGKRGMFTYDHSGLYDLNVEGLNEEQARRVAGLLRELFAPALPAKVEAP